MKNPLFPLLALLLLASCGYREQEVDLVVHNARIITLDSADHVYQAMAVRDGRIVELGAERQILNRYRAKQTFDAANRTVYPGFIDGHCHFLGYGLNKQKVDLSNTRSWQEVLERTAAFAEAHPGDGWILGRGWDQNLWEAKEFPDNQQLNARFPGRPVLLQRVDGHAAVANQAAMDRVGLNTELAVEGGLVVKRDGRPTGLLVDNAVSVFQRIFDEADEDSKRQALLSAQADCFAAGLTMVCDAGLDTGSIALIERMQASGELRIRVYAMVADSPEALAHYAATGPRIGERLIVRSVKVYADGALGSRGALLKAPYHDHALHHGLHHGLQLASRKHFQEVAEWCARHGFQMNTHCIGDSANALLLGVYGEVLGGTNDLRWRIEHAQVVSPNDRAAFGRYSIIPSVQPTHAVSDAPWAGERLGPERMPNAYAYEQLRRSMGLLALGTDFPVEGIDPLATFRAAIQQGVTADLDRRAALSRENALRGMTIHNAIATFTENQLGSLEEGKLADFTVVDGDLLSAPAELLDRLRVVATFVNGERVH